MSGPNPSGFLPGQSVLVLGQSVWMTVEHTWWSNEEDQWANCIWFDTKNRLQRERFNTKLLIHALPPEKVTP